MAGATRTAAIDAAREALDRHVREIVGWHFDPATGCPFWLDYAKKLDFEPRERIHSFDDLKLLGHFEDEWLRGGPVRRWVPKGLEGEPLFVFETGGSTGVPSRVSTCGTSRPTTRFSVTSFPMRASLVEPTG